MTFEYFKPYKDLLIAHGLDEEAALTRLKKVSKNNLSGGQLRTRIAKLRDRQDTLWENGRPTQLAAAIAKAWACTADDIFPSVFAHDPEGFSKYWQSTPYAAAANDVTRNPRPAIDLTLKNPNLTNEERLEILHLRYPEAPENLLEAIVPWGTPYAFAREIHSVEPLQSRGSTFRATVRGLFAILNGSEYGLGLDQQANAIIQATANFTGLSIDDLVYVMKDEDRLYYLREEYPAAPDALLQVMAAFPKVSDFAEKLRNMEPLATAGAKLTATRTRLRHILLGNHSGLKQNVWRTQGFTPSNLIVALGELTGLDHRYFLLPQHGGIRLRSYEYISYEAASDSFAIVSRNLSPQPVPLRALAS